MRNYDWYAERRESAIIEGIRRLWEAGELYMIDVPRHMREGRLVIVEQRGRHAPPGVFECGWLCWGPWGGTKWLEGTEHIKGRPQGAVTGWEIRDQFRGDDDA